MDHASRYPEADPQCNGLLEHFHSTLAAMIRKSTEDKRDWDVCLPYVLFAYRDSVHESTGFTPFELLFGRDVRGPLSLLFNQLTSRATGSASAAEYVDALKRQLHDACTLASERDVRAKQRSKDHYDKGSNPREFNTGDQVLVLSPSYTDKLSAKWEGPYTIAEKLNAVTYRVSTPDKKNKTRLC